ncbi:bifunctional (p)ppGpp synthetase/guanosine-3',5'-bis(diphosphate) 3'-pyrophosphohydrolase [uncultured Ruminococcus sp.]|jgi:guanosine-3',5'-bis(diphosphate) 3'-pyrophosphohydrolase|uniref:RelA/SpoT family protein n=1 Tax=uncultured Ruminococcus sp. TaxID=165186 RepID=UPI00262DB78F|nr:bifunctional (p)ppGpp synthetase/guanosine-3',5'-bis(diphosphate) 3'-pyrophosphohydrolase [uncultured Ruminococcus sp.]
MKNEVQSGEEFPEKRCTQKPVAISDLTHKILETDKQYDLSKIVSAYQFAKQAHGSQTRSSGEPYIIHPLSVAMILVDLGMDTDTICVGLLHDVVEDTEYTLDDIRKKFGQDVAVLVDGVTKLNRIPIFDKEQQQAENVRKILLAMSHDIRVMIIKLADRIHNMRTLCFLPPAKQRRIALETMNVYAPIAHRLGIRTVKEELEDLSFYYLDSFAYAEIEHIMEIKKDEREAFISSIKERIRKRLAQEHFAKEPIIEGRVKSIYGIYKKVYMGHKSMDQIFDKYAVRVIVSTVAECYMVLGIVHDMFRPLPNRFKDYISTPKSNMYQSLHTTVLGRESIPFEIQIRTWDMHVSAEYGIAAHWKYKEGIQGKDKMEERLAWVRKVIEAQQTSDDVEEIVRAIKNDLSPEDIVVMTPRGDSISLPVGSTVIDFAYRIHTQIGHKTIGGKVDGKMVPLDYELKTGEICEVLTSKDPNKGPNRAWLGIVKTNEAKSKIRSWFKKECREENITTGRASLEQEFKRCHINLPESEWAEFLADDLKRHNCDTVEDFYASIGYGGITLSKIMPRLKEVYVKTHGADEEKESAVTVPTKELSPQKKSCIILDKINDCAFKFSQCCNPLPGEEIVGFVTRGHGISVHSVNCVNYQAALKRNDPEEMARWLPVRWSENTSTALIPTSIEVVASDRVGLVFDITKILSESHILIVHSSSRNLRNGNAIFEASVQVAGADQLKSIMDKLRKIQGVISVERAKK